MKRRIPSSRLAAGALAVVMTVTWPALTGRAAAAPNTIQIDVKHFMFAPNAMTVKAGSTVTWTNMDQEPHTITSSEGLFRSGALDTHDTFSFRFDKAGIYHYLCTLHPQMQGTVVVD